MISRGGDGRGLMTGGGESSVGAPAVTSRLTCRRFFQSSDCVRGFKIPLFRSSTALPRPEERQPASANLA